MKWPNSLTLIRHDVSAYNELKGKKTKDPLYLEFQKSFKHHPTAKHTQELAQKILDKFKLPHGDWNTPLVDREAGRAKMTARNIKKEIELPDIIFVSPYERTQATLSGFIKGWPELAKIKCYTEDRIREQEHGLALLYNDWRIFESLHPEQHLLHNKEWRYYYRYPQGENVPDVRERLRSWVGTLIRDFSGKNVLAITHHLSILSLRANLERLDAEQFLRLDNFKKNR